MGFITGTVEKCRQFNFTGTIDKSRPFIINKCLGFQNIIKH